MAQRRMFSRSIVRTDAFLEMPLPAQSLYFHLGMEADDDGFVNPKMIMRTLGSSEDDLKVLLGKRFLIPFEIGVIVIRHWKENNYIKRDRYKKSIYQEEFKRLRWRQNGYILDTQIRLESGKVKERKSKDNILTAKKVGGKDNLNDIEKLADYFIKIKGNNERRNRYLRTASELLSLYEGNLENAKLQINKTKEWADKNNLEWELETVIKKYLELNK